MMETTEEARDEMAAVAALVEYERRRRREAASGPLVSGVVHVVLLLLLSWMVVPQEAQHQPEQEIDFRPLPKTVERQKPKKQPTPQTDPTAAAIPKAPPAMPTAVPAPPAAMTEELPLSAEPLTAEGVFQVLAHDLRVSVPGIFRGRDKDGRDEQLVRGEADPEGQDAVMAALRWLARVQRSDGSWEGLPAPSGLALLCFLAHGETPSTGEFAGTVSTAIQWLAMNMKAEEPWGAGDRHQVYAHAIATYALAEAYGMTQIPLLREPLANGINTIIAGQQPGGGFDYHYRKGPRWDTSVTGWQAQAMIAAYLAGADHPDLADAIDKTSRFLEREAFRDGRFGYTAAGQESGSASMTGIATVALQLAGRSKEAPAVSGAGRVLASKLPTWQRARADWSTIASTHLYGWYYDTQAVFHHTHGQGPEWDAWNRSFQGVLVENQHPDGYWSHDERHGMGGDELAGRVLATTLCCLQLEVYYRHLASFSWSRPAPAASRLDGGTLLRIH